MRRLTILLLAPLLLIGASCGGGDSSSTASKSGSGGSGGSASGSGFCKRATLLDKQFTDLEKSFSGSSVPSGDVFGKAAKAIDSLAKDAPSEIKADLKTVAGGVRKVADALSGIDLSDPKALSDPANAAKLQKVSGELSSAGKEVQAASDRVSKYMSDTCGIDIGSTSTSTTSTTQG